MDFAHFLALTAVVLIIGASIAGMVLFCYLDVQRTSPWRVKHQVMRRIDAELQHVAGRSDISLQERSLVQTALLNVKREVDQIRVNW